MAYGTDVGRKISDKYAYFIRGRQLIIVEYPTALEVPIGDEPPYVAPTTAINSGLLLEYTAIPDTSGIVNESSEIPLNDTLALALVDYIRATLIDSPELIQQREYYMTRFRNRIAKYVTARVGGVRRVVTRKF